MFVSANILETGEMLAGSTGLEPAASGVTGRRSNQLNYNPAKRDRHITRSPDHQIRWWAVQDSNLWQPACKAGALPTELTAPAFGMSGKQSIVAKARP